VFGSHPSAVHAFESSQLSGTVPGLQTPFTQASPVVQALLSVHVLVLSGVPIHAPFCGSQLSSVHELPSSQPFCPVVTHTPFVLHAPISHAVFLEQALLAMIFCVTHDVAFVKLQVLN
jgi:hypothetical protein